MIGTEPLVAEPPAVTVAVVVMGSPPLGVTFVGLNEHVLPVGSPLQAKLTGPLKLLTGVTVMVAVPVCPANTDRLLTEELTEKLGGFFRATATLFTSTEPRPVAISYPGPAEKPTTPVEGHRIAAGWPASGPGPQRI